MPGPSGCGRRGRDRAHAPDGLAHAGCGPNFGTDPGAIGDALIAFLQGEVVEKSATHVVLAVAGVGYVVSV
ncbi:MAG: hypothetical protein E6F95_10045, partial [Actinobacteria bacterium]